MGKQIVCSNCLSNADQILAACPYCGQSFENTNPAGTLAVNTLLAERYTIGRVLSLDGEGILYAAVDNETVRRVVVKEYVPVTICAARSRDGKVIPRQGREVLFKTTRLDFIDLYRSLVALGRTEGLTQVVDLVEANNTAYAVREPDDGIPLHTYLEQRAEPLTPEEALLLLRPVANGVAAMHRMGLLHRGISPETVYITKVGTARLSGYATLGLRTADSELKSQMFDGYAAPEQYAVAEFDGKYTDIYGLGALFYRALTGRTPIPSNLRRMNDTLPAAHTLDSEIPGYVSAAIARAMRVAPAERMQTAPELIAALTTPEKEEEGFHLTPRQWKFIAIGAAGLLLVAAVSIWAILSASGRGQSSEASGSETSSLSESLSASVSESVSVSPVAETFTVPRLVGKKYADVAANTEYTQYVGFLPEYEFSKEYAVGEIIRQSHPEGTQVAAGTIITVTVSNGPETVLMPTVIGRNKDEVAAELTALRIQYEMYAVVNSGSDTEDAVVQCDTDAGTPVEIDSSKKVLLYVAGPAPEPEPEPEPAPTPTPEPAPDSTQTTSAPAESDTTAEPPAGEGEGQTEG